MIAYLIAPVFAFVSSIVIFIPSEIMLLMLANMNKAPLHILGHSIDLTKYGTSFPWLLPFAAAFGSNMGSALYYMMGSGAMRMNAKFKSRMERFDFERMGRARDAVVLLSAIVSVPPISLTAIASGMIRFRFARYFLITFVGKVLRFYAVLLAGQFALDALLRRLT